MPPSIVYGAGYCRRSAETLYRAVVALGATVLDIRAYLVSEVPEWDGPALQQRFGGYYRPCPAWGDVNYNKEGAPIQYRDFAAGLAQFEALSGPVILLGFHFDHWRCHRSDLILILNRRNYRIGTFNWEDYEGDTEASLF